MYKSEEEKIIGLKVESLSINKDKTLLVMKTDKGDKYLYAIGDCCSSTWFENISGVDNLIGHTILSLENKYLEEVCNEDYDYTKFYSFVLKTEKGNFEIEYRNSSNGYYGGDIELEENGELPYGYNGESNEVSPLIKDF